MENKTETTILKGDYIRVISGDRQVDIGGCWQKGENTISIIITIMIIDYYYFFYGRQVAIEGFVA